jgi:hypothetical protein
VYGERVMLDSVACVLVVVLFRYWCFFWQYQVFVLVAG